MAWRVRKSIKVAPGTRINISGSGVSATTRIGKTGVSHRTQLVGGRKSGGSSGKKSGCLPVVIGVVLLLGLLGALFGGGDKAVKALPSPEPSAALAVSSPSPTPEPMPLPELTSSPEPTPGPLDELQSKIDGLRELIESGEELEQTFVINTATGKFHRTDCSQVSAMDASHRQYYTGKLSEVKATGYEPCGICFK